MKVKEKSTVAVIGGSDGPTSIFIAGKLGNSGNVFRRMKNAVRKALHRRKRKKILSKLKAEPHSIDEVVTFIKEKYGADEVSKDNHMVYESYKCFSTEA